MNFATKILRLLFWMLIGAVVFIALSVIMAWPSAAYFPLAILGFLGMAWLWKIPSFHSLIDGLEVTWNNWFKHPTVTEVYPHKKPEMSEAFRGPIEYIRFEDVGTHKCIACKLCEQACPSQCIHVEGQKIPGLKSPRPVEYTMNFALCSLCGLCIDACPTHTLQFSKRYEDAGYHRDWTIDLLEPFREDEARYIEEEKKRQAERAAARKKRAAARRAKKKTEGAQ